MKSPAGVVLWCLLGLLLLAAITPALITLFSAVLPVAVVLGVIVVIVRLVFFHTRRW
jgi:hypothetical protein